VLSSGMEPCKLYYYTETRQSKTRRSKGYRPISLLSCIGKIFEKIAAKRIATAGVQYGAIANK
jgi:hypothetical protein